MIDPITGLMIGSTVAKGVTSIAGSIFGQSSAESQAKAQNKELKRQFKQELRIYDKQERDKDQLFATKLGKYDLDKKAINRAASRAYGIQQYNQASRVKQAASQSTQLQMALASAGGSAAAAGKSGKNAGDLDASTLNSVARNQAMIAQNLLIAEETAQYEGIGIQDQMQSQLNQAYSPVAVGYTRGLAPLEPTQVSAPSRTGMFLDIAGTAANTALGVANVLPTNPTT